MKVFTSLKRLQNKKLYYSCRSPHLLCKINHRPVGTKVLSRYRAILLCQEGGKGGICKVLAGMPQQVMTSPSVCRKNCATKRHSSWWRCSEYPPLPSPSRGRRGWGNYHTWRKGRGLRLAVARVTVTLTAFAMCKADWGLPRDLWSRNQMSIYPIIKCWDKKLTHLWQTKEKKENICFTNSTN